MTITPASIQSAYASTNFRRMTTPRKKHRVIDRDQKTCIPLAAFVCTTKSYRGWPKNYATKRT